MAARTQCALRDLTRRDCPSTANEVSAASFATGHEIEHHRVPLTQRGAAAFERRRIPAHGFAWLVASTLRANESTDITVRLRQIDTRRSY